MAHALDSEYNASPFYLDAGAVARAWEHVRAWIPVKGGTHYPAAFDRWKERPATKAVWRRGARSKACKERYVAEAIAYIHQKRLHVEMDSYEDYEKEVMLEVALQLVILKHERLVDMDTAAALVARAVIMADRAQAIGDLQGDFYNWWERLNDGSATRDWWNHDTRRSVFAVIGQSGGTDAAAVRRFLFGDAGHFDPLAFDHMRMLRMAPQHTPWKLEVTGITSGTSRTCLCVVHDVDPFCLSVTLDTEEEIELFPESASLWSGYTFEYEAVKLNMNNAYNVGAALAFDRHVPDEDTALFAPLPDDEDETDEVNNRPEVDVADNENGRMVMAVSPTLDDENQ